MLAGFRPFSALLAAGLFLLPAHFHAQQTISAVTVAAADLPDAPRPQFAVDTQEPDTQEPAGQQTPPTPDSQQPAPGTTPASQAQTTPAAQGTSSSQSPATPPDAQKSQHDKAEEQIKQQEKQRVMGVMATFNTTNNKDALPLSAGQKFHLFFKSATDPWAFSLAGVTAGVSQARNSEPEWGQGAQGYFTRYGASYGDYFIGNFFGNAVLPSLLHEDPRYFQKGSGSMPGRILWAASSTVWCRRDSGKWGPNWSNVAGNLIGSAISRAYYPASERNVTDTITNGLTVTAVGIFGSEVIEFWPDVVRHHHRKLAQKQAEEKQQQDAPK
jgi:hypothetical protein